MQKLNVLSALVESALVAVVRAENAEQAKKVSSAVMAGGVKAVEITYTVPGATDVIADLKEEFGDDLIVGAGTVLDSETARIAILAGAKYVVSPSFDAGTAFLCNRYQVPYLPGAVTIKDVVAALEHGSDIIKVFPGELNGPGIIKAFKGPVPHANLMPTGGVSVDNVADWISAGAVAVGAGGSLIGKPDVEGYDAITERAKKFLENIARAREGK